jgi:hypothetical protein
MASKTSTIHCELFGGRKDGLRFSWRGRPIKIFAFAYAEHDNQPLIDTPRDRELLVYYAYQGTSKSCARYVYAGSNATEYLAQKKNAELER